MRPPSGPSSNRRQRVLNKLDTLPGRPRRRKGLLLLKLGVGSGQAYTSEFVNLLPAWMRRSQQYSATLDITSSSQKTCDNSERAFNYHKSLTASHLRQA